MRGIAPPQLLSSFSSSSFLSASFRRGERRRRTRTTTTTTTTTTRAAAARNRKRRHEQQKRSNGLAASSSSSPTIKGSRESADEREEEEDQGQKENDREVIILWDLDNVNPGTTCERFAINAQRIKKASKKFGSIVSFNAFAGMQTSRDLSECCNNDNNNTKDEKGFKETFKRLNLKTEFYLDGPDAADLRLGRRLMEFANECQGKEREDVPAFITRRAEEACFLSDDEDDDTRDEDDNDDDDDDDDDANYDDHDDVIRNDLRINRNNNDDGDDDDNNATGTVACNPELKNVSFCEQTRREYRNLAMAKQELLKLEGEKIHAACLKEKCSPDETKLRQIVKNRKHVAIVVTNDRDLKLPLDYAISMDVCVVLIGNFVDNSSKKIKSLVSSSSKKKKTSFRRLGGGGRGRQKDSLNQISWDAYLDTVRLAAQKRPIGRLKLLENADAALIWDSARRFRVSQDERDVLADAKTNSKEYETSCPGDVVGMWRRHKSGVGAWFSSFDEDR